MVSLLPAFVDLTRFPGRSLRCDQIWLEASRKTDATALNYLMVVQKVVRLHSRLSNCPLQFALT